MKIISIRSSRASHCFLSAAAALSLVGCTTVTYKDQASHFRDEFPQESRDYILSPAPSREHVAFLLEAHEATIRDIFAVIRKRLEENPERIEKTLTFLEGYDWERLFRSAAGEGDHVDRMQDGDALYFFRYTHPSSRFKDQGYLVLRDGRIVFRDPHEEEGDRDALTAEGRPIPLRLDNL